MKILLYIAVAFSFFTLVLTCYTFNLILTDFKYLLVENSLVDYSIYSCIISFVLYIFAVVFEKKV